MVAKLGLETKTLTFGVGFALIYSAAAATAKSLQSCPTLCDPIDGSPPGSPVPGILQARALEWGAIAFSDILHYLHIKFEAYYRQVFKAVLKEQSLKSISVWVAMQISNTQQADGSREFVLKDSMVNQDVSKNRGNGMKSQQAR